MKALSKWIKTISLFFATIILFQGCVVYQKKPGTLERAFQEGLQTKVVTYNDNTYKFKRIEFEDGTFYGVKESRSEITKVPLLENELAEILLKNKAMSNFLTIGASIVLVVGLLSIWFINNPVGSISTY